MAKTTAMIHQELAAKLIELRGDWTSRVYIQNVEWTDANEKRRAGVVETIDSLLDWRDVGKMWTVEQVKLVKKLLKSKRRL